MHPQTVRPDHDHTGEADDEHQHEKKSVLKKVKAKAKKIKDTLKLHGHGGDHDHDHDQGHDYLLHNTPDDHDLDEEDDEEEEMVDDSAIHGVSGLHTRLSRNTVPDQVGDLGDTRNYYGSSEAAMKDQELSYPQRTGQQEDEGNRVDIERISDIKEKPYTHVSSPESFTPGIVEQPKPVNPTESFSSQPEITMKNSVTFEEDPHAPGKSRSQYHNTTNYETKVNDPTGQGTKEIDSSISQQLGQMDISNESEPRAGELNSIFPTGSHDQFSPEPSPPIFIRPRENPELFSEKPPSDTKSELEEPKQSSYTEKISSAVSAIADKAISAKNVVASELGYGENSNESENQAKGASISPVEYGKKIYDKVAETGSNLMSKGHSGTEIEGQDKGVSMKGYLTEKLKPGEEDRALSELISEALQKQKDETENPEKKLGKVTESVEVRERLGGGEQDKLEAVAGNGVVGKIKEVVGSLFGKADTRQSSQQSSIGNERFENEAETMEKRPLQESGN